MTVAKQRGTEVVLSRMGPQPAPRSGAAAGIVREGALYGHDTAAVRQVARVFQRREEHQALLRNVRQGVGCCHCSCAPQQAGRCSRGALRGNSINSRRAKRYAPARNSSTLHLASCDSPLSSSLALAVRRKRPRSADQEKRESGLPQNRPGKRPPQHQHALASDPSRPLMLVCYLEG